jgi:hypothetical protein
VGLIEWIRIGAAFVGAALLLLGYWRQYRRQADEAQQQRWANEWNGLFWAMMHERMEDESNGRD